MNAYQIIKSWFSSKGWKSFPFQEEVWQAYLRGENGLLNAPTGSGKTYALGVAAVLEWMRNYPDHYQSQTNNGLQLLWVTPLKALSKDIEKALTELVNETGISWKVGKRTGDTSSGERERQKRQMPEILIITPESLHLLLASKGYPAMFRNLRLVVADEWHELLGTKRGVHTELALSRLKSVASNLRIWGISATIGNLQEATEVLLGEDMHAKPFRIVRANIEKRVKIETLLPDEVERFPWAGHLGIKMLDKVIPIIRDSKTTLIFTNTRSQCEIWYQRLLEAYPELAGVLAIHHGSISSETRTWVEEALHQGILKAVVCTSSLDLGVDFHPVDTVVQVGSPKSVGRFLQRAGRSGHQPGAVSVIYFAPTSSLELIEGAALRTAADTRHVEDRIPVLKPMDVLCQYLVTLAVSEGFEPAKILSEIRKTFSYGMLREDEWQWALQFITSGGATLQQYEEYSKVEVENGRYLVNSRKTALRHRLSIGTIVSEASMRIKFLRGSSIGSIEESFIARMKPGDVFVFAGRVLELIHIKGMIAYVKRSKKKTGIIPRWDGGRMPLSSQLSEMYRDKLDEYLEKKINAVEVEKMVPLLDLQFKRSGIPHKDEFMIEVLETTEGYHAFFYPFEGRLVHEGLAALFAFRISQIMPISFSIAMNDYGFELLADKPIPLEEAIKQGLFDTHRLVDDIQQSVNSTEMARRKFREIAAIAGLVFSGYPGRNKSNKHLQASSGLLFDVFSEYDRNNLLILQAYEEVLTFQLEEGRMRKALERIRQQKLLITHPSRPTPFAFPILVDRLREKISSEKLEDRIKRMQILYDEA
ncbi:MAG: ligase-associated DNA damage response DEXH box helicase [Bacteroidia bacterium]